METAEIDPRPLPDTPDMTDDETADALGSTPVADLIRSRHSAPGGIHTHWPYKGAVPRPSLHAMVITCMDTRIDVLPLLGLEPGDIHIIRNAGAVITDDVERSLALSQHLLGTREVVVIGHTDCGVAGLAERLTTATGEAPLWRALGFSEVRQSVADGVERLRRASFVVDPSAVSGYVLDLDTGALTSVA